MKIRVLCLIACIISSGCAKKDVVTYYIPDYLKQYGLFQVGSYWVFKNEITGKVDSSFIVVPPDIYYNQNYSTDPIFQACDLSYGGNFIYNAKLTNYSYGISFIFGYGGTCLKNKNFQPGYVDHEDQYFTYMEVKAFDSLSVNNIKYFNVLETQYQSVGIQGDITLQTYYLGKSIGLIKFIKELDKKDTTWSLLRCHVKQ